MDFYEDDKHDYGQGYSKFAVYVFEVVEKSKEDMEQKKGKLLNHPVCSFFFAEPCVNKAQKIDDAHDAEEEVGVFVTGEEGGGEGHKGIEASLFAIIGSPGLYSFGESLIDWLSYKVLVIVMNPVSSDQFVLVVE